MEERRRAPRVPTGLPARCYLIEPSGLLGPSFEGEVVDLSAAGFALRCDAELEPATLVYVEITLPGGEPVTGDASVVRGEERAGGRVYGTEIVAIENAGESRITRFAFAEARRRETDPEAPAAAA
jgi:hypothetical protein